MCVCVCALSLVCIAIHWVINQRQHVISWELRLWPVRDSCVFTIHCIVMWLELSRIPSEWPVNMEEGVDHVQVIQYTPFPYTESQLSPIMFWGFSPYVHLHTQDVWAWSVYRCFEWYKMNPNICVFIHLEAVREYIFVINFSAICCNPTLGSLHSCSTVNIQLIVYTEYRSIQRLVGECCRDWLLQLLQYLSHWVSLTVMSDRELVVQC